ncbi:hypothetical protein [Algiphilus sp.]|uniref:hypothetical protein n=1 Tax=Algiphilus sp. TaxID=1872431 RepID=UPI003B52AEA4
MHNHRTKRFNPGIVFFALLALCVVMPGRAETTAEEALRNYLFGTWVLTAQGRSVTYRFTDEVVGPSPSGGDAYKLVMNPQDPSRQTEGMWGIAGASQFYVRFGRASPRRAGPMEIIDDDTFSIRGQQWRRAASAASAGQMEQDFEQQAIDDLSDYLVGQWDLFQYDELMEHWDFSSQETDKAGRYRLTVTKKRPGDDDVGRRFPGSWHVRVAATGPKVIWRVRHPTRINSSRSGSFTIAPKKKHAATFETFLHGSLTGTGPRIFRRQN